MKKFLSVLLFILLLAAVFSACGGEADPAAKTTAADEETTGERSTEATGSSEITSSLEMNTTLEENTQVSTEAGQNATEQPLEPKTEQELLAMYNKALAASGSLRRREFKRSIAAGGLWRTSEPEAVLDLAKEAGMPALIALNNTQPAANDLTALQAAQVKSIRQSRQNGQDVITIQLREYRAANLNQKSAAGYVGITTLDESKVLVKDIAKSMYSIGAVSVSSSKTQLFDGTITAALSGSGGLESVTYTAKQKFDADLKILVAISAGLTISFHLSAQYR